MFGDWNSPTAIASAVTFAAERRYECLRERCSLIFETVFSSQEKLDFVQLSIDSGFFVRLFFIGTESPHINAARVAKRVMEGGHTVPIEKIVSRYQKSIDNLCEALLIVDRGYVYDNSIEGAETPKLQFRTIAGKIERVYSDEHTWASDLRVHLDSNPSIEEKVDKSPHRSS